jgi:hypothetical protein
MKFRVTIPQDEEGLTGRECPVQECLGVFKVEFGTGLKGEGLPCHCPYCGHVGPHNRFFTQDQIEYAKSIALNEITSTFLRQLKKHEFNHPARGPFGIGISLKVTGRPTPIHRYREKQLETVVVCERCTLRYAIYGVFGYCPDCGVHNSLQILEKNLEIVAKQLTWAESVEPDLSAHLIGDALENAVSAFDGFGRELCHVARLKAADPSQADKVSFQNIATARDRVQELFGFNLAGAISDVDWASVVKGFQKRHLVAHKMGVVDQAYVKMTGDTTDVVGRKVRLDRKEVEHLARLLRIIGAELHDELA